MKKFVCTVCGYVDEVNSCLRTTSVPCAVSALTNLKKKHK